MSEVIYECTNGCALVRDGEVLLIKYPEGSLFDEEEIPLAGIEKIFARGEEQVTGQITGVKPELLIAGLIEHVKQCDATHRMGGTSTFTVARDLIMLLEHALEMAELYNASKTFLNNRNASTGKRIPTLTAFRQEFDRKRAQIIRSISKEIDPQK